MIGKRKARFEHAGKFSGKIGSFMVSACFSRFIIQLSTMIDIEIHTHIFPTIFKLEEKLVISMRRTLPIQRGIGPRSLVDDLQEPGLVVPTN